MASSLLVTNDPAVHCALNRYLDVLVYNLNDKDERLWHSEQDFPVWPIRSRDISVWLFQSGDISVTTFLYINNCLHFLIEMIM